jgi:hypothetical protein
MYVYDCSCKLTTSNFTVKSIPGTNILSFISNGTPDYYGILVRNVQLRQVFTFYDEFLNVLKNKLNSTSNTTANTT